MISMLGGVAPRRGPRIGTGWLFLAWIALALVVVARLLGAASRRALRVAMPALGKYMRWFWGLSTGAKITTALGEAITVALITSGLPLPAAMRTGCVYVLVSVLMTLLVGSLVFGPTGARRRT